MRRAILIGAGLLLANTGRAQTASQLPSTETQGGAQTLPTTETVKQPAPGQPGVYQPGGPSPVTGRVSKATDEPKKEERPGRYVYDSDPSDTPDSAEGSDGEPGQPAAGAPEVHVVKKGDTLWDLSSTYFRNPWAWPKLWAYNPSITNPHWIYPGDLIHLAPPPGQASAALPPAQAPQAQLPRKMTRSDAPPELFLRQTGFVEPGELKAAGKIVGSKEEKIMLATLDEAYVQFPPDQKVQPGDRLTVYKTQRPLLHPATHKRLGDIVQIFGEVEVKSITNGHIARVVVVDCTEDMQRGYRVGPLKRQFRMAETRAARQDLTGVVVDTLHPRELVATETLVFVDRGKKDGVEVGNRFLVVRRGDGYQALRDRGLPVDDKRFPRETIGELLVLDVREGVSTTFMTHVTKEALVGDRVEEHKGY